LRRSILDEFLLFGQFEIHKTLRNRKERIDRKV
jgi:hypothetical protein